MGSREFREKIKKQILRLPNMGSRDHLPLDLPALAYVLKTTEQEIKMALVELRREGKITIDGDEIKIIRGGK